MPDKLYADVHLGIVERDDISIKWLKRVYGIDSSLASKIFDWLVENEYVESESEKGLEYRCQIDSTTVEAIIKQAHIDKK